MGSLKDALLGRRFADDGELAHGVQEDIRRFRKEFYTGDLQPLKRRRKKRYNEGDFVKRQSDLINTLRTGDADLRFCITTVQDG